MAATVPADSVPSACGRALGPRGQSVLASCGVRVSAHHLRTFAIIAVGAGVGAGIVHEGQLLRGAHGAAGEVALLPLSADYQRRRAASPDEAGGLILLEKAQAHDGWQGSRPPTSLEELFDRGAGGGDGVRGVAVTVIEPETVILAGGVGANEALVHEHGPAGRRARPIPATVVRSALSDRASLVGAVALAIRRTRVQLVAAAGEPHPTVVSQSLR